MASTVACSSTSPSSALCSRVSLSGAGVPGLSPVRVCVGRSEAGAAAARRFAPIRAQAQDNDGTTPAAAGVKKKGKPVAAKQRVLLKFLWLEKNIGIALDQEIPGHGSVPLSPYFFWPRKDAWEELRAKLESKSWISRKRTIILLNQATDIINLWQQSSSASQ